MNSIKLTFAAFILFTSSFSIAQIDSSGRWFSRAPLPTPRQEIAHTVLDGKVYVCGGLAFGGVGTALVEVFDPSFNTWSTVAPLPEPLHHLGLAVANGNIYVLGGYRGNSFVPNHKVYSLNPDSNIWREKTSMPIARGAHIAVTFQERIFLIGGVITGFTVTNRTDVYNSINDSWLTVANMPTAREHLSGSAIDSLIFVAGGRVGNTNTNKLEAYSPLTNFWYAKPNMPTARGGLAAATLNGMLYVFGGEIPGVFPQNEQYNPSTNSWKALTPMKTPRHGIGAATVGDSVYIIGGGIVQGLSVTNANDVFTLAPLVINLTVCIEGFFNPVMNFMVEDTITVFLRKTYIPFQIVDSARKVVSSIGFARLEFNNAVSDSGYYIVIKHRNSIETWSAIGNSFAPSILNFDFTSSLFQAYGNNLILNGNEFCIFSGDVNQDGIIDAADLSIVDNDVMNYLTGYVPSDVTGDGLADASDLSIVDNNTFNGIIVRRPE